MKFAILLQDQTVGQIQADTEPKVGDIVTVEPHDENGNPKTVTGVVEEILESSEC